MINFKEFTIAFDNLKEFFKEQEKLKQVLDVISPTSTGVVEFGSKFIDGYIQLLSAALNDKFNWVSWYMFECEFGTKKSLLTIKINNTPLKITSLRVFYDFLGGKYDNLGKNKIKK